MNVTFTMQGPTISEEMLQSARNTLELAMREMGTPPDTVTHWIIADAANFGAAVRSLKPGTGYTDDGIHTAVGKTLRLEDGEHGPTFGIVIRDFILGQSWMALSKAFEDRTGQEQRCLYVIYHELAHVADMLERIPRGMPEWPTVIAGRFKIRNYAAVRAPHIWEEAVVCRRSGFVISQAAFGIDYEETQGTLRQLFDATETLIRSDPSSADRLRLIAHHAANAFWVALDRYAKLYAFIHGNPDLAPRLPIWASAPKEAATVLQDFTQLLADAFAAYPEVLPSFEERALEIHSRLAATHGITFGEHPTSGDGVWIARQRYLMAEPAPL